MNIAQKFDLLNYKCQIQKKQPLLHTKLNIILLYYVEFGKHYDRVLMKEIYEISSEHEIRRLKDILRLYFCLYEDKTVEEALDDLEKEIAYYDHA